MANETIREWERPGLAALPERRAELMRAAGVKIDCFTRLHIAFAETFRRTGVQTKKDLWRLVNEIKTSGNPISDDPLIEIVAAMLWYCSSTTTMFPEKAIRKNGVHATPKRYLERVNEALGKPRPMHAPLAALKAGERLLTEDEVCDAAADTLAMLKGTKPFPKTAE